MTALFAWMVPGWVLLLLAVALVETLTRRRRRTRTPVATTFTDEFTAMLYPTKRRELDQRATTSMLADTVSEAGAPPLNLDLIRGTVAFPNSLAARGGPEGQGTK